MRLGYTTLTHDTILVGQDKGRKNDDEKNKCTRSTTFDLPLSIGVCPVFYRGNGKGAPIEERASCSLRTGTVLNQGSCFDLGETRISLGEPVLVVATA